MESPPLTVLIPTHGRPTLLERTLDSLAQCLLPGNYVELVVIENGSRAGAKELVRSLPDRLNARYMHRSRGNKSYALNEALESIDDGLVVFFDDDVEIQSGTLDAYADAAMEHGRGHFFGGTVQVNREKEPPTWVEPSLPDSARGYVADGSREGKYYLGFNWAAYSRDLKRLGGFDPQFGPGAPTGATGQETEMQERLRVAGIAPVDVPGAVVSHYVPKENCTVRWMLSRKYRAGLSTYYQVQNPGELIRDYVLRTIVRSMAVMVKSMLTGRLDSFVFSLGQIAMSLGVIRGMLR